MKYFLTYTIILFFVNGCINRSLEDVEKLTSEKSELILELYDELYNYENLWLEKEGNKIVVVSFGIDGSKNIQKLSSSGSYDEESKKVIEKAFDDLFLNLVRDTRVSEENFSGKVMELRLSTRLNDIYTYNIIVYNKNYKRLPSKNIYWPENEGKFVHERIAISFYK